jgi:putative ABC transport system permease protein
LEFIEGSAATALRDPQAIVLTKSLAKKIFQDKDPIGQLVSYQERDGFKVSAIIDDPPASSSMKYSFVVNIMYNDYWRDEMARAGWSGNSFHTFFVLPRGADPRALEKKFPALLNKYRNPDDYKDYPFQDIYMVQPVTEIYFQSGINFDIGLKGNLKVVYSFLAAAIIVLLLACVNYMNLAIARSIKRSKEVGIRKVSGAFKHQIVFQFLSESVLIAVISLLLAVGLTYFLLPYFSEIMERPLEFNILSNPYLLPGLLAVVVVVGFLSGSYPAFVMSSLRPIEVLKVKAHVALSGIGLQRSLVVIQFAASVTLVVVSLLIYMQLKFVREKDLGYDKQNVVTLRLKDFSLRDKFPMLFNEWTQSPNVVSATLTSHLPTHITSSTIVKKSSAELDKDGLAIYRWVVEYHFMDVFGLELLSGRSFSKDLKTDIDHACVINETAAKALGWSASEAVGKEVYKDAPIKIIGVIKDFHMHSMHLPIQPLMVRVSENRGNVFSVKIKPTNTAQTIAFLENVVRKISSYPFQYEFLDDNYDQLYKSETRLGEIFGVFTFVSILIAALGLFGLAAFIGEQRTKEIGIRKVLGASVNSIIFLLSKGLMKLVVIAIIIAIPISWYIIQLWLQDFAYRIEIQWWTFAVAGLLALLVANISIGYQSIKASFVNPVDSLRSE